MITGLVYPPEYGDAIRNATAQMKGAVTITGRIPPYEMNHYYAIADAVVAPTVTEEAFGMITLESMSMEKPIIISDSGGMPEIVNNKCGIIVHRGNDFIQELSDAMIFLYKNPKLRVTMGKSGRESVLDNYDFRKEFLHDRMMALFEEFDNRRNVCF